MTPVVALVSLVVAEAALAEPSDAPKPPVPVRVVVLAWEQGRGRAVLDHLGAELPDMTTETATRTMGAEEIIAASRGREAVILLELSSARITAVRPDQKTVITRVFAPNTGFEAPYSFAVATLELIDIAAERRLAPPPTPPPSPAFWAFGLIAGPAFTAGLGSDPSLFQLSLGLDVLMRTAGRGAWWAVGPRARFLGQTSRELVVGSERFELAHVRQDLSLRASGGLSFGVVDLGLSLSGGVSLANSEVNSSSAQPLVDEDARLAVLGPGLEARYALGAGLGLSLSVDVLLTLEPVQYLVRDEVVLEDGRVRTVVSLALGWQSGDGG